jgi:hypothetical protein
LACIQYQICDRKSTIMAHTCILDFGQIKDIEFMERCGSKLRSTGFLKISMAKWP